MNKVILLGRLTKDPEVRYSQSANPIAIARYTLAVNRSHKREGQPDADFINIVAFAKKAEFAQKHFRKGQQVAIVGQVRSRTWDDDQGQRHWVIEVVVSEQHFAGDKKGESTGAEGGEPNGFYPIEEGTEDSDLPF